MVVQAGNGCGIVVYPVRKKAPSVSAEMKKAHETRMTFVHKEV